MLNLSYLKITNEHIQDVSRWKRHYGLRVIGSTPDGKKVVNGLDVYKFTSALGFDLELLLTVLDKNDCVVDWLSYVKSATIEKHLMSNLDKKLSYAITEVYGERYWLEVRVKISLWFIEYMKDQQ